MGMLCGVLGEALVFIGRDGWDEMLLLLTIDKRNLEQHSQASKLLEHSLKRHGIEDKGYR